MSEWSRTEIKQSQKHRKRNRLSLSKVVKKTDTQLDGAEEIAYFKGNYDWKRGTLEGTWGESKGETIGNCSFYSFSKIPATIEISTTGTKVEKVEDDTLLFDLNTLKFKSRKDPKKAIEMNAIEHVESCQLIYLISKEDVQFI